MDGFVRSVKYALRSISFNGRDKESMMIRFGSGKMTFLASLSFRGRELETKIPLKSLLSDNENNVDSENQRHNAAIRLQKVYKSFRTRRQLADCAVLVEQRWWKVLDFAELKRSSVSFFEIEKPQSAVSRWSRARTRAAKVGKGLSKDEKARKLALQHWLEAIDPRHRYGHNLHFYYVTWLQCNSKQPFFYWLDVGDGREVNLERCPRSKLHQQCIKYLGPTERRAYEVIVEDGILVYKQSGQVIDTTGEPKDVKWIFVLSTSRTLYVGKKNKGIFQHSSFLAGGATLSAGRLEVENGIIKAIWPHSGHYLPTEENFQEFTLFLSQHNVDLTDVKQNPYEEGEFSGILLSDYESSHRDGEKIAEEKPARNRRKLPSIITKLRTINKLKPRVRDNVMDHINCGGLPSPDSPLPCYYYFSDDDEEEEEEEEDDEGYETAEDVSPLSDDDADDDFMFRKQNLFDEDQEDEKPIPKEKIMQRIDSHTAQKSYQLAHQLVSKWTTGAGPRIGCMKDYPSELRFRILERLVSKTKRNQKE